MSKGCCNRNPIFVQNVLRSAGIILPEPPFVIAAKSGSILNSVSNLNYEDGDGPSNESPLFRIIAEGLSIDSDNITVTPDPSGDFEVFNGTSYTTSPFTIPYTGGGINTALIYKIRLKSGLVIGSYSGQITISAPGATDFIIVVSGSVEMGQYIEATGGTITRDGDYLVHEITATDIFEVTQVGPVFNTVEYRFFGGGGGGALDGGYGGGGGAGGERTGTVAISVGSYPVVIGAGGPNTGPSRSGNDSTFNGITALGGGGGGMSSNGENGGSGGGASRLGNTGGIGSQGNNGGDAADAPNPVGAGGGGGAGTAGQKGQPAEEGGAGGNGSTSTITGVSQTLGGGGGGGGTPGGAGGSGGGGDGGASGLGSTDGAANTGSGGGGNTGATAFGMGGSGIWQARYYHPL